MLLDNPDFPVDSLDECVPLAHPFKFRQQFVVDLEWFPGCIGRNRDLLPTQRLVHRHRDPFGRVAC
ncbi:hypothetical protein A2U01_0045394 [Trifolium medium]|uniref:Uncharacterized protein n=1 Tax=Trifolium medium TaxID=97028 RepID=A0A392QIJ8_9FABA|nr:hypothetical protein [Trifolium medium]